MSDAARRPPEGAVMRHAAPVCDPDPATGRCMTCADEALEARVLALAEDALAEVEMGGEVRSVAVELIDGVRPGDVLLVHAGVAIARVDEAGADAGDRTDSPGAAR